MLARAPVSPGRGAGASTGVRLDSRQAMPMGSIGPFDVAGTSARVFNNS